MTGPGQPAGPQLPRPSQPTTVAPPPPPHPIYALTTYELRDYRRQLESAITFFDRKDPVPPARGGLQTRLDEVIAEQQDRQRLADARP